MAILDTAQKRKNTLADLARGLSAIAGDGGGRPAASAPTEQPLPAWLPWLAGAVVLVLVVAVLLAAVKR